MFDGFARGHGSTSIRVFPRRLSCPPGCGSSSSSQRSPSRSQSCPARSGGAAPRCCAPILDRSTTAPSSAPASEAAAEADLRDRRRRHDELELRPLAPRARTGFMEAWQGTQAEFVDDPSSAIDDADRLIQSVMSATAGIRSTISRSEPRSSRSITPSSSSAIVARTRSQWQTRAARAILRAFGRPCRTIGRSSSSSWMIPPAWLADQDGTVARPVTVPRGGRRGYPVNLVPYSPRYVR